MSDKKRDCEKKGKNDETEKNDEQYSEMPIQNMHEHKQMPYMCPMMHQCPMMYQCPMSGKHKQKYMQMPMSYSPMAMPTIMQMRQAQENDMRINDWFDDWDEFSEDSSFEFDSDDFDFPEKYYKKHHKKYPHPYFWPPFFPYFK